MTKISIGRRFQTVFPVLAVVVVGDGGGENKDDSTRSWE